WLAQELADLAPLAEELGLTRVLAPLQGVLDQGNQAMSWLAGHQAGLSIPTLLNQTVEAMASQEAELLEAIATDGVPGPLG
ncbi:MAG: putative glutamate--cysteine ligase, partial [Cyanobium sp. MAG_237]|nr:putative glutamate--cysteine ligase [Cyanobium sp. MAG_237]